MRLDLFFSNWIILWSLIYIFNDHNIIDINPYIWCCIVALVTSIAIIIFIYKEVNIKILLILILILIVKISLIFLLNKKNILNGFLYGLILFFIYNIWLYINKTNIYKFYYNIYNDLINNDISRTAIVKYFLS